MPEQAQVITANLGPRIAAVTCLIKDRPTAVVNTAAAHDPVIRAQAASALLCMGLDAGHIIGALHGVRS